MADEPLIRDYLTDLDRALGPLPDGRRRRILAEAEDHLGQAAASSSPEAAIERFGDPVAVARAHLTSTAVLQSRRAVVALGTAGVAYGAISVLTSPATFGIFPGGPWPGDVPPPYLAWKVDVAGVLVALAALLGFLALASLWRSRRRPEEARLRVAGFACAGALVFVASWPFETVFLFQRAADVPDSPSAIVVALVCVGYLICTTAALLPCLTALRMARASALPGRSGGRGNSMGGPS